MLPAFVSLSSPTPSPASSSGDGMNRCLLIVAAVVLFVFVASASIHLLLRFLTRQPSSSVSSPFFVLRRRLSSSSSSSSSSSFSSSAAGAAASSPPSLPARCRGVGAGKDDPLDSLPVFTLGSSLAALPKSSPDCAVCLSRFLPDDQLRLLPSCRHAFHSACIDTWLCSSLSCPLCRSPIHNETIVPPPPPPPFPAPSAPPLAEAAASDATASAAPSLRSGSYRIEIGSVSRRRTLEADGPALPPNARSYSLGSSFEYVVDEEVEAVVTAVAAHIRRQRQIGKDLPDPGPNPPGDSVAESAGGGAGGSRNWLKDYLDRLASSASSSFSSLRISGRDSRRSDAGSAAGGGSWDLEDSRRWPGEDDEITRAYNTFSRWLVGA